MKIKNVDLINLANSLSKYTDKKLPQRISYAIIKNLITIKNELNAYEKSISKILESYKDYIIKDQDGNDVLYPSGVPKVDEPHVKDYEKDIDELLNIEVDINFYKISNDIEEIFNYDDSGKYDAMSPLDIMILTNILCENTD